MGHYIPHTLISVNNLALVLQDREVRNGRGDGPAGARGVWEGPGEKAPRHADQREQLGVGAAVSERIRSGRGDEPASAGRT